MITQKDIVIALKDAGLEPGMTVFSHANIAFFGRVEGAASMDDLIRIMLGAFQTVLGPDGTLLLPVFTYSFGADKKEKVFNVQETLSTTSGMGNWLVTSGAGARSADPMLSVVATGGKAEELTSAIDPVCFGVDSIWARLHAEDGMICNLNLDAGSTFLHWVERELGVSYRSDIPMEGTIVENGNSRHAGVTYTGRDLKDPLASPRFEAYHRSCVEAHSCTVVGLGRGAIVSQSARTAFRHLQSLLEEHPFILTSRHPSA